MLGKIYDQNGNLVEGSSLTSYVEGSTLQDLDRYEANEFYERNPGDARASRATNDDIKTRWSTKGSQNPLEWYDQNVNDDTKPQQSWMTRERCNGLQYISTRIFSTLEDRTYQRSHRLTQATTLTTAPSSWQLQVLDYDSEEQIVSPADSAGCKNYFKNEFGIELDDYLSWEDDRTDELYGHRWRTVATGNGAGSLLIAPFPEEDVLGLRILRPERKGNYWSIDGDLRSDD